MARIRGQEAPVRILKTFLERKRLPHALLFSGIDGIGKFTTARLFATAVLCERREAGMEAAFDSCERCRSCRLAATGNHPDLQIIEPEGSITRIGRIRELLSIFALKSHAGGYRVAILRDAPAMNPEAANALLKILEEPPERSLLILTADRVSDLLPTIVSRCQSVRFRPLDRETLERLLSELAGVDRREAEVLAFLGRGSSSAALTLHAEGWIRRREWLMDRFENLAESSVAERLALAELLSRDRRQLAITLEMAAGWFRDLAVAQAAPESVENKDQADRIGRWSARLDPDRIQAVLELILKASRSLTGNLNTRLTVEVLLMRTAALLGAV
ncbi:MAG: DNA polymerase III subunit delta' [Desulfobacterales bacterium]